MNLRQLAPDIQEEILFLPRVVAGRDPITERDLRPIAAELNWEGQGGMWGLAANRFALRDVFTAAAALTLFVADLIGV
jgi:hypothetical protein